MKKINKLFDKYKFLDNKEKIGFEKAIILLLSDKEFYGFKRIESEYIQDQVDNSGL